jgi:hypothetical protein
MRTSWRHKTTLALPAFALALVLCAPAAEAACTATGFIRDSINLTAALINPHGTVRGDVDATGCNIGIYYGPGAHGRVELANVHGANYFGIVNNGATVDIKFSAISDIGEKPFNGTQHGVAIYFAFNSNARGNIIGNVVWNYQKGGIVVNGPTARSNIQSNRVVGLGPVAFIAQNGIQAGFGANVKIEKNVVHGNSYTGAGQTASGGILVVGGACYGGDVQDNTDIDHNAAFANDVGIWLSNLDASCNTVTTPTRNSVDGNLLVHNAINNTTGHGAKGYQAGIADEGSYDEIKNNDICGLGYKPPGTATVDVYDIDVSGANNPRLRHNTTCSASSSLMSAHAVGRKARGAHRAAKPIR